MHVRDARGTRGRAEEADLGFMTDFMADRFPTARGHRVSARRLPASLAHRRLAIIGRSRRRRSRRRPLLDHLDWGPR